MREIRQLQRCANLVVYALSITQEIEKISEPSTYADAISSANSSK